MKQIIGISRGDDGLHLIAEEGGRKVFYPFHYLEPRLLEQIWNYMCCPDMHEPPLIHCCVPSTHSEPVAPES